jgi:hypothetical protein
MPEYRTITFAYMDTAKSKRSSNEREDVACRCEGKSAPVQRIYARYACKIYSPRMCTYDT